MDINSIREPMFLRVTFTRDESNRLPLGALIELERFLTPGGGKVVTRNRLQNNYIDVFPNNPVQLLGALDILARFAPSRGGTVVSVCMYELTEKIYNRVFGGKR